MHGNSARTVYKLLDISKPYDDWIRDLIRDYDLWNGYSYAIGDDKEVYFDTAFTLRLGWDTASGMVGRGE